MRLLLTVWYKMLMMSFDRVNPKRELVVKYIIIAHTFILRRITSDP